MGNHYNNENVAFYVRRNCFVNNYITCFVPSTDLLNRISNYNRQKAVTR